MTEEEKNGVVQLPIPFDVNLPTYQNILSIMGDYGTSELIKDAIMAYSIKQNYRQEFDILHFNGPYGGDIFSCLDEEVNHDIQIKETG